MSENEEREAVNPADALREAAKRAADEAQLNSRETAGQTAPEAQAGSDAEFKAAQDEAALVAAEKKAAESYDLYVRAVAEMENVRRRCAEDVQKAQKFGVEKFAKNLLPVVDSLEKALEAVKDADAAVREGLEATYKQLTHALEVSGMTPVDPQGEPFDPNTQQAICMVPAAEGQKPGTVAVVMQKGWKIHERVLRAALVSVVQS